MPCEMWKIWILMFTIDDTVQVFQNVDTSYCSLCNLVSPSGYILTGCSHKQQMYNGLIIFSKYLSNKYWSEIGITPLLCEKELLNLLSPFERAVVFLLCHLTQETAAVSVQHPLSMAPAID